MTGGTLLVKCGALYSFTKVAHDGYDLKDFVLLIKNTILSSQTPEDICLEYLKFRQKTGNFDFDPYNPVFSEEDKKLCIYSINNAYVSQPKDLLESLEFSLNEEIEEANYDDEHPYCQLACSYTDYILFIDLDNKHFVLNGEVL